MRVRPGPLTRITNVTFRLPSFYYLNIWSETSDMDHWTYCTEEADAFHELKCPSRWILLKVVSFDRCLLVHQLAIMKAIANCGPKNPCTSKWALLNFQRRRAFIALLPSDGNIILMWIKAHSANGNLFQVCSLRLFQSLNDVKQNWHWGSSLPINEQGGTG